MELHLDEAARLMGYEVVEDREEPMEKTDKPRTCKNCGNNETKTGCGSCTCSKDDLNNPSGWTPVRHRICEVLGGEDNPLEVGERFSIDGYPTNYGLVQVCEDGKIRRVISTEEFPFAEDGEVGHKIGANALYYLLNHPDRIIRKPRFSQQEVAAAKMFFHAYPQGVVERGGPDDLLFQSAPNEGWDEMPPRLFPSLRPGKSVKVEDILGGGS